jgi:hypothetical protein
VPPRIQQLKRISIKSPTEAKLNVSHSCQKRKLNKKPLKVYLDYNVIVSLQNGEIKIEQIKDAVGTTNIVFPFSASHIEEVKNMPEVKDKTRTNLINDRLAFIDGLTKTIFGANRIRSAI